MQFQVKFLKSALKSVQLVTPAQAKKDYTAVHLQINRNKKRLNLFQKNQSYQSMSIVPLDNFNLFLNSVTNDELYCSLLDLWYVLSEFKASEIVSLSNIANNLPSTDLNTVIVKQIDLKTADQKQSKKGNKDEDNIKPTTNTDLTSELITALDHPLKSFPLISASEFNVSSTNTSICNFYQISTSDLETELMIAKKVSKKTFLPHSQYVYMIFNDKQDYNHFADYNLASITVKHLSEINNSENNSNNNQSNNTATDLNPDANKSVKIIGENNISDLNSDTVDILALNNQQIAFVQLPAKIKQRIQFNSSNLKLDSDTDKRKYLNCMSMNSDFNSDNKVYVKDSRIFLPLSVNQIKLLENLSKLADKLVLFLNSDKRLVSVVMQNGETATKLILKPDVKLEKEKPDDLILRYLNLYQNNQGWKKEEKYNDWSDFASSKVAKKLMKDEYLFLKSDENVDKVKVDMNNGSLNLIQIKKMNKEEKEK